MASRPAPTGERASDTPARLWLVQVVLPLRLLVRPRHRGLRVEIRERLRPHDVVAAKSLDEIREVDRLLRLVQREALANGVSRAGHRKGEQFADEAEIGVVVL